MGTLATDWDTIDDKIQQKLIVFVNIVGDWLTGVMEEGLKKGSLTFNGDPQTRAMLIITSIMAAAQMAKIMGPASFQSVKNAIINEVNRQ